HVVHQQRSRGPTGLVLRQRTLQQKNAAGADVLHRLRTERLRVVSHAETFTVHLSRRRADINVPEHSVPSLNPCLSPRRIAGESTLNSEFGDSARYDIDHVVKRWVPPSLTGG